MKYQQNNVDQLNSLYIRMIRYMLACPNIKEINGITSFSQDLSPTQASKLLKNILKQQQEQNIICNQINTFKGIQKGIFSENPRNCLKQPPQQFKQVFIELGQSQKQNKVYKTQQPKLPNQQNQKSTTKLQKIRKITNKLTAIFVNNQNKINQYNEMFKNHNIINNNNNNNRIQLQNKNNFKKV